MSLHAPQRNWYTHIKEHKKKQSIIISYMFSNHHKHHLTKKKSRVNFIINRPTNPLLSSFTYGKHREEVHRQEEVVEEEEVRQQHLQVVVAKAMQRRPSWVGEGGNHRLVRLQHRGRIQVVHQQHP